MIKSNTVLSTTCNLSDIFFFTTVLDRRSTTEMTHIDSLHALEFGVIQQVRQNMNLIWSNFLRLIENKNNAFPHKAPYVLQRQNLVI